MTFPAPIALALLALSASGPAQRTPVLVELFTSLGCSSCPPADKLLMDMDRQQPVGSARLIVLSEHVDYWDNAQWGDPFSSPSYTARQQTYDSRFGVEMYTPQLVIDGTTALPGSNWNKIADAIQRASGAPTIPVHVTATRAEGTAQIDIEAGPSSIDKKAVLYLALTHDHVKSHIGGGENAGEDLSEVSVAYSLKQIGKIDAGSTFKKSLSVPLPSKSQPGDVRVIAFLRRSDTMQVIGADQVVF